MGITAFFLLFSLLQQGGAPSVEYKNPDLDLAFSYPKSWVVTTKRGISTFSMPIPNSTDVASIEILSVKFNGAKNEWQDVQASFIKTMRRDVVRQWEEEILGVPMLMTESTYKDAKGHDMSMLTAMLYSLTPRKMVLRLTAPANAFDDAEFELRHSLQSLHTMDGSMPQAEDPNRKVTAEDLKIKPIVAPPKVLVIDKAKAPSKIVKGAASIDAEAGGNKVALRFDSLWSAVGGTKGEFLLKCADVDGAITVTVNSTLDSDAPTAALYKLGSVALGSYLKVVNRTETDGVVNNAGAKVWTVWRTGTGAQGPIGSCEAFGLLGDYYWLASWQRQGTPSASERKSIDALFSSMSIEPTP